MVAVFCDKCRRPVKPGELTYQVHIELISMFDGFIPAPEIDADVDEELERLVEIVSRQDPEEAAKDVAQTIRLVICRRCRNQLVADYDVEETPIVH